MKSLVRPPLLYWWLGAACLLLVIGLLTWKIGTGWSGTYLEKSSVGWVGFSDDGRVLTVQVLPDQGVDGGKVIYFECPSGKRMGGAIPINMPGSPISLSPDGSILATGPFMEGLELWDVKSGSKRAAPKVRANAIAFSPNGRSLAVGEEKKVTSWDTTSLNKALEVDLSKVLSVHIRRIVFSPDGTRIAVSDEMSSPLLIDLPTRKILATLDKYAAQKRISESRGSEVELAGPWQQLAFSPDGKALVVSFAQFPEKKDHACILVCWNIQDPAKPEFLWAAEGTMAVAFSKVGKEIATGVPAEYVISRGNNKARAIRLLDAATGKETATLASGELHSPCHALAFSPDGSMLAEGGNAAGLRLWRR